MTIVQNLDTWHLTMISQYSVLLLLTVLPSTWLSLAAQFTRVLKKQTPKPFGKHGNIETLYQKLPLLTVMMWTMTWCHLLRRLMQGWLFIDGGFWKQPQIKALLTSVPQVTIMHCSCPLISYSFISVSSISENVTMVILPDRTS